METFALYLLKSVTWLSSFALVFFLFLKNERFFLLNRIYLLSGILISFLFPLISVHYSVVLPVVTSIQTGSAVATGIQAVSKNPFLNIGVILSVFYFSGVLCVSFLIIKQSRPVLKAIKRAEIITTQAVKLIRTAEYPSSFSFFSYVFVNPSITDVETEEIVNHELAHIRQWHWLDLVLVELLCMLQWFNPLIWIYIRFIRQNHEYLADEVALQRTSDPAVYKATLLNQIVGSPVVSLANSFNYSLNKKRFNMMKNIISSPYRKMKIFLILPVFVIVLYAFATPEYKYMDISPGITYPSIQSLTQMIKGNVVQQDGKSLQGATIVVQGTTLGASTDSKGYFLLDKVPEDATLVVSFVGFKTKVVKPVFTSPMTIKMLRDTVNLPGVSTPPPPPPPPPTEPKSIGVPPPPLPPPPPPASLKVRTENGKTPLYVVDGIFMTEDEFQNLDPESIGSISAIKDKVAIDKYGDKGKDGVLEVTTKKVVFQGNNKVPDLKVPKYSDINQPFSLRAKGKPLFILDGIKMDEFKNPPSPNSIESISVLKSESAVALYGEEASNGVIIITSKKTNPISDAKMSGFKVIGKGDEKETFVVMEELPSFPGGEGALKEWLNNNIRMPEIKNKSKTTGPVYVLFIVTSKGKIKEVKVKNPVHPALDAEAVRLVRHMPDWKPGTQDGKPVDVIMQVPIDFKLK